MNYKELGLKAGLECHQQLETGKLFSRYPSILSDKTHYSFTRKLRPTASETGEMDKAALEAFEKNLEYKYLGNYDSAGLVEADEEPPSPVDKEALKTILKIALMCNSKILDELIIMRKTVIDGSNTTGFQRTGLVALGGEINSDGKKIGIQTIVLEEDSARTIETTPNKIVYNLDRLGIPLIELATEPVLHTPEEVKNCALKIGQLFRRTCKAKRGLGSIRQDVNISIKNGARTELKGVQDLELMDEYVRREVQRQTGLLEIKKELKKRGVVKIENISKNLTKNFTKTNAKLIQKALKQKGIVLGLKLENFSGLLGKELQPDKRFATELADYIKQKTKLKGLIHSDELPKYGISEKELEELKKELKCGQKDGFVLILGPEKEALKGINVVVERCEQGLKGVPNETRNALEGGNSGYSRPLPGAARMYPETDLRHKIIEKKELQELKKDLPLTVEEREKLYKKHGLSEKLANEMKLSNHACFFESMLKKGFNATTIAVFVLESLKKLERENIETQLLDYNKIEQIFEAQKKGIITKDVTEEIAKNWIKEPEQKLENIIRHDAKNSEEIETIVKKVVQKNSGLIKEKGMNALSALMGDVMKEMRGKASGKQIAELLKKELEKK